MISLDFELAWGIRDHVAPRASRRRILGAREAVPRLLEELSRAGIRATWAAVGLLFARDRDELLAACPERRPAYRDPRLSPYPAIAHEVGPDEARDPLHYARSLLERIAETPGQEVATHTFSHYYCLEPGQTAEDFDADLEAAARVGTDFGPVCTSLVFPRNQNNPAYREVLRRRGVRAVRAPPRSQVYAPSPAGEPLGKRALRLADSYLPVVADRTFVRPVVVDGVVEVPASAFLRPITPVTRAVAPLATARIAREMTRAARRGRGFHLWWHPHNFGLHLEENLARLRGLLDHFRRLRDRYGMSSLAMGDLAGGQW